MLPLSPFLSLSLLPDFLWFSPLLILLRPPSPFRAERRCRHFLLFFRPPRYARDAFRFTLMLLIRAMALMPAAIRQCFDVC